MTTTDEELVVRAAVSAVAKLPNDAVQRLGDERAFTLLAAATTQAVRRKFSSAPTSAEIQGYVQELKVRFPDGADMIKPIVAEAMIRSAFGEDDLLAGIGADDLRTLLFLLPYAIISEKNIQGEKLDAFVNEVLAMASTG